MEFLKNNKIVLWILGAIAALFIIKRLAPRNRRRKRAISAKSYPRRKIAKRSYTKGGKAKKAWQIKGSKAAKARMARLRRMRNK